jgi:type IV pilus assembly protein PilW
VENLQVLYGEDSDADQVADNWRTAGAVADWSNVVALRVALLVAGVRDRVTDADPRQFVLLDQTAGPFNDGRIRRVLNFTVALRNHLS